MKLLTSEFGLSQDIQTKFVYQSVGPNLSSVKDFTRRIQVNKKNLSERFQESHTEILSLDQKIDSDFQKLQLLKESLIIAKSDKKDIRTNDTSNRSDRKSARKNVREIRREVKGLEDILIKSVNKNQRAARKSKRVHNRNLREKQDRSNLLSYRREELQELVNIQDTQTHSGIMNRHQASLDAAIAAENDAKKAIAKGIAVSGKIDEVINKCITIEDDIRNQRLPHKLWKKLGLTRKPKAESTFIDQDTPDDNSAEKDDNTPKIDKSDNIEESTKSIDDILFIKLEDYLNINLKRPDLQNIKNQIGILLFDNGITVPQIKEFFNKHTSIDSLTTKFPFLSEMIKNKRTAEIKNKKEKAEEIETTKWNNTLEKIGLGHLDGVARDTAIFKLGRTNLVKDATNGFKLDTKIQLGIYDTEDLKTWLKDSPYAEKFYEQNKFASLGLWIADIVETGIIPTVEHKETEAEKEVREQADWVKNLNNASLGSLANIDRKNLLWTTGKENLKEIRDSWSVRDYFSIGALGEHNDLRAWLKGPEGIAFFSDPKHKTLKQWIEKKPSGTVSTTPLPTAPVIGYDYESLKNSSVVPYVIEEGTTVFDETWSDFSDSMGLGEADFNKLRHVKRTSLLQLKQDLDKNPDSKIWNEVCEKIGFIDVNDFREFLGKNETTKYLTSGKENLTQHLNEKLNNNIKVKLTAYNLSKSSDLSKFNESNPVDLYKLIESNPEILDGGKICDSFRSLLNLPQVFWAGSNNYVFKLSDNNIKTFILHRDKFNSSFDDDLTTFEDNADNTFEAEGSGFVSNEDFSSVNNFFSWLETGRNKD